MAAHLANVESDAFKVHHDQWPQYYAYHALDPSKREIRVLRMLKEKYQSLLKFELLHRSLNERPQYDALSYYWGVPTSHKTILINDTAVEIRETLYQFLNTLWSRFGSIVIWLDVLCINQRDVEERNTQVSIMANIFKSAQNVYAWLGNGDSDSEYAMLQILQSKSDRADSNVEQALALRQSAEQLLMRPYWSRVWVMQEVLLANKLFILYGSEVVTWDDLETSFELVRRFRETTLIPRSLIESTDASDRYQRLQKARTLLSKGQNDFFEMAEVFHTAQCTDPRDKLFGLRGIAKNGELIEVDYSKSPTQIFLDSLSQLTRETVNIEGSGTRSILDRAQQLCFSLPMFHSDIEETLGRKNYHHFLECLSWVETLPSNTSLTSRERSHGYSRSTSPATSMHQIFKLRIRATRHVLLAFGTLDAHSRAIQESIVSPLRNRPVKVSTVCVGNIEICRMNKFPSTASDGETPKLLLVHISPAAILALLAEFEGLGIPGYFETFLKQQASVDSDHLCQC